MLREHYGIQRPAGADVVPLSLFGDEVTAFKNELHMVLNWSAEFSPVHSDCKASKYLVLMLPKKFYFIDGKSIEHFKPV